MEPRISIITLGVTDLPRSIRFYRDGLGFSTQAKDDAPIAFFMTGGTRLTLYPRDRLADDIAADLSISPGGFGGVTLGHVVRKKGDVARTLELAERAGGRIAKAAQDVFWGGHSGYFADPDGYFWEVAWGPMFSFDDQGAILLGA